MHEHARKETAEDILSTWKKEASGWTGVMENLRRESRSVRLRMINCENGETPCKQLSSTLKDNVLRTSCVSSVSFLMGSIPGNTGLSSCSHDWQEKLCIPIVTVVARKECFAGEQESPCIKLA